LDCAASEFYRDGVYDLSGEGKEFNSEGFTDIWRTSPAATLLFR